MLRIEGLTYRTAGRVLLDRASAAVPAGHKLGPVGLDGTGKSMLRRLIAGKLESDEGSLALRRAARVAEVRVEKLTAERAEIEAALADPSTDERANETLTALARRRRDVERRLAEAETAWLEAQEALETSIE